MKKIIAIFTAIIISLSLAACGGTSSDAEGQADNAAYYNDALAKSADGELNESADAGNKKTQSGSTAEQGKTDRKIIEYINLSVETKTFDALIDSINATVKESGGYIESSQIGGNSYFGKENRTAELKVRIPKTKQSDFSDFLSKNCNVVSRSVDTDDVTDRYIDIQSRIKALTLEKETLEKFLTQSSNVSDTLTVYEKLTTVIAEIESYQSRLNQMDNLIDYTTFTVHIDEVEKVTKVKPQNWFVKTWNGFIDNFFEVGNGLLNFISFIISAIPYWILLGVIAFVIVLIIRRIKRKK